MVEEDLLFQALVPASTDNIKISFLSTSMEEKGEVSIRYSLSLLFLANFSIIKHLEMLQKILFYMHSRAFRTIR